MSEPAALRVLVLEDSRFDAELLREHLLAAHPDAEVVWAVHGAAYLAALASRSFDLILSDYEIPGYSGLEALAAAQSLAPRTPFVFVSGVIGEDNAVEMMKRGATDYVSKSRLDRLAFVMDRALREAAEREGRERAEAQLRVADGVYGRVVDSLQNYAVILLDGEGRIHAWNRAAREIFGHDRAAMLGRSAECLFTADDQAAGVFAAELALALEAGKAECDRWMLRADGSRLRAEGIVSPLFGDDGAPSGFCKIVHDVTAAYEHAAALQAAKEEAERANRAKDRFLAMLSHELRTPLTPISAAAHALERVAQVPERFRHLLPMIRRNVAIESRLIDDLLDVTTIGAGKIRLRKLPVDMHQLVQDIVGMVRESLDEKGLDLRLDLAAARAQVLGDEARLHQVVWNVVRNAVKFTPAGGAITLRTADEAGCFVLCCSDTGVGIAPEALPRIFGAFEQEGTGDGHGAPGLGLGLAIADGLVQAHGGTLTAESDGRGQGARFTLRLPALDATGSPVTPRCDGEAASPTPQTDAGTQAAANAQPQAGPAPAGHRILLVEDNLDAADALRMALEPLGHVVLHAATCSDALSLAARERFDVVVSDLGLPDGSGIDVGRALAGRAPVIALTGYGQPEDLRDSAAAGFHGHLVKPADPQVLHETILQAARAAASR
ncbi:response regulator [Rhizobacter sp. LjRoot28]|uniref:hybrid sensor histidine kinase/response regulator n=1 Tax=Rhizobacter sp. LjRoot28 TaxID=3342309 RepID=UPI003ED06008